MSCESVFEFDLLRVIGGFATYEMVRPIAGMKNLTFVMYEVSRGACGR